MDEEELPSFNDTRTIFSEPFALNGLISLSVTYAVIFITGILGNISTCIVIGRTRSMHTATNFYLISLSLSDIFLLICGLPLEVNRLWKLFLYPFGEKLRVILELISVTSTNATVLTITAFTFERYIELFKWQKTSKLSRIVRYIIAIWIFSLCAAVLQVTQFGIATYETKEHEVQKIYAISISSFFFLHISLITILFVLIFVKLHTLKNPDPVERSSVEQGEQSIGIRRFKRGSSQRKVIRMLGAVVLSYFLCWAPYHGQRLIAIYEENLEQPNDTFNAVYLILKSLSGVLYFLFTAINPILYNIMSDKFRNAFKVTLTSWCRRPNRFGLVRTYSAMLESQKKRAEERTLQRTHHPQRQRHIPADSSQLRDVPPQPQSLNLNIVKVERESWNWRQQLVEGPDPLTSPQSISNSSLRELDQEKNREELANYLYQVNCEIHGEIRDTSV